MANISNVINVALIPEGQLAFRDNMNICAVMTSEQGILTTANRYELYTDPASVSTDFGTSSQAYDHAQIFFAQTPNPVNTGGYLVMGYWRGASETTAATAGTLTGIQLSEATIVDSLQAISDGAMDITVDGVLESLAALDFRVADSLADIVGIIDAALSGATATEDDQKIIITSDTTGAASTITVASEATIPGSGTFVGTLLGLAAGTGATLAQGAASAVLTAETKLAAITALQALVNIKGFTFIDNPTDEESTALATWAQANSVLGYDVFDSADNLEKDVTNVVWATKLSGLTNYRMLYSAAGNRKLATGYMSRAHVVNFNAENSALTMHLKEVKGVPAEDYSQTDIAKAKAVGLDVYTTIKDVTVMLTSGANDFMDNRYNIIAFVDAVQTDMFNLLKQTGTKIPQTRRGVNQLIDQAEKTTRGFVRAGVFAPGTWSSPDYFGDYDTFARAVAENGFYWMAGALSDQSQADRAARKSPVLQGAVKNAGAIHSIDLVINLNL
jgi:hypothetical protein